MWEEKNENVMKVEAECVVVADALEEIKVGAEDALLEVDLEVEVVPAEDALTVILENLLDHLEVLGALDFRIYKALKYRSASSAAIHPVPAAVTACL